MTIKNKAPATLSKTHHEMPFRLNKVTSLMLASALLSVAPLHTGAQTAPRPSGVVLSDTDGVIFGNLDGQRSRGYLITGDERFGGDADVRFGSSESQSLVHNFRTIGGAGSGGGAGLGGAFFVDAGASLTVINTDFASNRVQGGNGGGNAPVSYVGRILNIVGEKVELNPLPVVNAGFVTQGGQITNQTFTRDTNNNVVSYTFDKLAVSADTVKFLSENSIVVFNDFQGATSSISDIRSDNILEFAQPVSATATSIGRHTAPVTQNLFVREGNTNRINEPVTVLSGGTTGFRVDNGTVKIEYGFTVEDVQIGMLPDNTTPVIQPVSIAQASAGLNEVNRGDKVFIGTTVNGVRQIATILEVIRWEDDDPGVVDSLVGKPKELILDSAPQGTIDFLDIVKAPAFDAVPFAVNAQNRRVVNTFNGSDSYVPGMTVTWELNGNNVTAQVVSVSNGQVTLDKEVPQGITSLNFVENPVIGDNEVRISGAASTFKVGQVVYVPSNNENNFVGTVTDVNLQTNVVTVAPQTAGQKLSDFYDPSLGLALKVSAATVSGSNNQITVPFNTANRTQADIDRITRLLKDRVVDGASFAEGTTVTGVQVNDGTVTLTLSNDVTTTAVESFSLSSPLFMGGSMNGLTESDMLDYDRDSSKNGSRGFSANSASSFFNDAEGVDGTNGKGAGDENGGIGYNGGAGGNGSNGLPVNFWLVYDVTVAGIQLKQATRNLVIAADELVHAGAEAAEAATELAAAIAPDPQGGLAFVGPDPVEIAAKKLGVKNAANELRLKTKNKINANFDLVWAISDLAQATTNLGKWAVELSLGLAGLGGAGGDGGQASGGADFFGGGRGGAGGNGGDGATRISDGGDGGEGGMGGAGGFGAGGGQGGRGGDAGANGNASGGDPGDGGFAGFGAGEGANGDGNFGGGGAGLGGSIFVRNGGTLLIQGNSRFSNNYVAGGSTASPFGEAGSEAGTDLFIMKGANVRLQPGQGKVIQFDGTIADDSFATNDGFMNAAGLGSDVRIGGTGGNGGGLVVFNGENTYSGHTILEGATLSAVVGEGVNDMSLIRFNGSGSFGVDLVDNEVDSTLSLDTVGTFLLAEDYTRRAETDPSGTVWTGSGGFAAGGSNFVTVNLGAINDEGMGQELVWGEEGFFEADADGNGSGEDGTLTFGSDFSIGQVEFTNNVDLDGHTARVAVYRNNTFSTSNATLSGNWVNTNGSGSTLMVGDSSGSKYNGTLFMTGQNRLDNVFVAGGTLSTFNDSGAAGELFKPTSNLVILADKRTNQKSNLHLFASEQLTNVSVLLGGQLTLTQQLRATGNFANQGSLFVLGTNFSNVDEEEQAGVVNAAGMSDYLPSDFAAWEGALTVDGGFANHGVIDQYGSIIAQNIVNNPNAVWNSTGDLKATLDFLNSGLLDVTGDIDVGRNALNTGTLGITGDLDVGTDLDNDGGLVVTGDVTVNNDLVNFGSFEAGSVEVTLGDLDNSIDGTFVVVNGLSIDAGTLRNLGALTVGNQVSVGQDLLNDGPMTVVSGGLSVGRLAQNTDTLTVTGSTTIGASLTNTSTAVLTVNEGGLTVGGALENQGIASVDGTVTVSGGHFNNTGSLIVRQGGLAVADGDLNNTGTGSVNITGSTAVSGDLTNSTQASFIVQSGGLDADGELANHGVMRVSANTVVGLNVVNTGNMNLGSDLQVGGDLTNDRGIALVDGLTSVVGNLINTAGAATFNDDVTVGIGLSNLANNADMPTLSITGNVAVGIGGILNQGAMSIVGDTTTQGGVTNSAGLLMSGDLTTASNQGVTNNGFWGLGEDSTITTGHLQGAQGAAVFCLSTATNQACTSDEATPTHLTLDLKSTTLSDFKGVFAGSGSLTKTGQSDLLLTSDQTFSGGLTINGGRVIAEGRMNDGLDITVNAGTYVVATDDIVKSVRNNAPRSVVLNADLTTTEGFVNNGRLEVNGTVRVADGVTTVERLLDAGSEGFSGSSEGRVEIANGTTLRLKQSGDSEYAGQVQRGDDASALIKEGVGKLTLSDTVNLKHITIAEGELALNKARILSADATVDITQGARLSLLVGDQVIDRLKGDGFLSLGTNNLSITQGGDFNGVIDGTGQVALSEGAFNISQSLSTTDASFVVNQGSDTSLGNTGEIEAKQLDVSGTFTLGSNASSQAQVAVQTGVNVLNGGTLKGTGTVRQGMTRVHSGGFLKPGHSPGILTFNEGLQLDSGSITEMEIANPAGLPGVGFDQLVVGSEARFTIADGATLEIKRDGQPQPLAQGQTVQLFNFAPGKVTGQFGRVTSELPSVGALSLATGRLVGLGNASMAQIRNTAKTENEKSIYNGLLRSTEGGVQQFYGGQFIERLVTAAASGSAATKAVFNAYNPESYLGLSDVSQAAAQDALPVWKTNLSNTDKLFVYASSTSRANQKHVDHQAYGLSIKSTNIGLTRQWGDNTVVMSFGAVNPSVQGDFLSSKGNGFNAGVSLYGPATALPNSIWYVGLSHADLKMRGTRAVGQASFQDVGTRSTQLEAGLESKLSFDASYLMLRGAVTVGQSHRDRVNETGNVNSLNTMSVHADKYSYRQFSLAVEYGQQISSRTSLFTSLNYEAGSQNKDSVTVGFDNDQVRVTVNGRSAMASNARLMSGVRHQYSEGTQFESSIGVARRWDGGSDLQARIGFVKKF